VHKNRSVKFCGIVFDVSTHRQLFHKLYLCGDAAIIPARCRVIRLSSTHTQCFCCACATQQGHRISVEPCSWFLRNVVRMTALGLFVLGILIYFQLVGRDDPKAGTAGYTDVKGASAQFVLALVPSTVVAAIALYLSIFTWKYGNDASIVVNSTIFNKWAALLLGSLCMLAAQIPPESSFRVTKEIGQSVLLVSIVLLYGEVEREAAARDHFAAFLAEENKRAALQSLEGKGVVARGSVAGRKVVISAAAAAGVAGVAGVARYTATYYHCHHVLYCLEYVSCSNICL
jgi:hypothetical protein